MTQLGVFTEYSELLAEAEQIAATLQLPLTQEADFLLILTPSFLGIQNTRDKSLPLYVDFLSGKMNYRRQHISLKKEALARAMGLKKGTQPKIIDATAGLARDSFIIAALGFSIELIERSPIAYALVNDGKQRALKNPEIASIVDRMTLTQANAISYLKTIPAPDIIYLDPMFPERSKSAQVKKEMQIFHTLIGEDADADSLLETALTCAKDRVVVKRPRLAPSLANIKPSYTLTGSSSRFDIYLTRT